jgi:hypothetical protein
MNRDLIKRVGTGIGREAISGSALIRGVVGTASAAVLVWSLGLPWLVLVIVVLVYIVYVLVRRVFVLERTVDELRAAAVSPGDDASNRRRAVRDELARLVAETQHLMETARRAFDADVTTWEKWKEDMAAHVERTNGVPGLQ